MQQQWDVSLLLKKTGDLTQQRNGNKSRLATIATAAKRSKGPRLFIAQHPPGRPLAVGGNPVGIPLSKHTITHPNHW